MTKQTDSKLSATWTATGTREYPCYRAVLNNRHIVVWRSAVADWSYGTAGVAPITWLGDGAAAAMPRTDIPCQYGAPSKHLAMADAELLAMVLQPTERPSTDMYLGRANVRMWRFNPAAKYAQLVERSLVTAGPIARRVMGLINTGLDSAPMSEVMWDAFKDDFTVLVINRGCAKSRTVDELSKYIDYRQSAIAARIADEAVTSCQIYNLTGIDIYLGKSHPAIKSITWHPAAKVEAEKPYAHLSEVARHGETPAFVLFRTQDGKRELCEGGVHTQPRTAATECAELNSRYPSITAFRYFVSDSLVGVEPIDGDVWASLFDEQRGIISMAHTPLWRQAVAAYGPAHGVEPCPECGNDDCTCPAPWTGPYSVAIALQDRAYGGPEEGGWYYTCGEVCPEHADKLRGFASEADAIAYARELNDSSFLAELNEGRRPISSVLSEGRYVAHVFDGLPANYPATRPHYE